VAGETVQPLASGRPSSCQGSSSSSGGLKPGSYARAISGDSPSSGRGRSPSPPSGGETAPAGSLPSHGGTTVQRGCHRDPNRWILLRAV
jgi:hypothetical protein